jgi:hypothetical protein
MIAVLVEKDSLDELRVETLANDWFQFAGKGPIFKHLFRLLKWEENG